MKNSIKEKILAITLVLLLMALVTASTVSAAMSLKGTESTVEEILGETAKTAGIAVQNRLTATRYFVED